MESNSILFTPDPQRFVLFPIRHPKAYDFFDRHRKGFWTTREVSLSEDREQWMTHLNDDERHFISHVLGFFAASDGIVAENLGINFKEEVQPAEVKAFYAVQEFMETIHNEMYSTLIVTLVPDPTEQSRLLRAAETIPAVKHKADWAVRWMDKRESFAQRLVAFACIEGIFFSSSFCAIFWIKQRNLMPGLTLSNEWISRDEALHTEFACYLYRDMLRDWEKIDDARVAEIVREAVNIEQEFATASLPVKMIGMNAEHMKTYIEYVADRLYLQLVPHGKRLFPRAYNPFPFMDFLSLDGRTSFFERRVSEYQRPQGNVPTDFSKLTETDF